MVGDRVPRVEMRRSRDSDRLPLARMLSDVVMEHGCESENQRNKSAREGNCQHEDSNLDTVHES